MQSILIFITSLASLAFSAGILAAFALSIYRYVLQRSNRSQKAPVLKASLIASTVSFAVSVTGSFLVVGNATSDYVASLNMPTLTQSYATPSELGEENIAVSSDNGKTGKSNDTYADIESGRDNGDETIGNRLASEYAELYDFEGSTYIIFNDVELPTGGLFGGGLFEVGGFLLGPAPDNVETYGGYFIYGWPSDPLRCGSDRLRSNSSMVASLRYNVVLDMRDMTFFVDGFRELRSGRETDRFILPITVDPSDPAFFKTRNDSRDGGIARYQSRSSIENYRRGRDLFTIRAIIQNTVRQEVYTCRVPLDG